MNKPKTDKLMKGIVSSSVALFGLTGCSPGLQDELMSVPVGNDETAVHEDPNLLPSPEEADCNTWTWDEEAEGYICAEEGSPYRGHYFYGGMWFPTMAGFLAGRATAGGGGGQVRPAPNRTDQNVTQPNPDRNNQRTPNQTTNPRSGMGGGIFGG